MLQWSHENRMVRSRVLGASSDCDQRALSKAGSSLQFRATTSFLLDGVLDPWLGLDMSRLSRTMKRSHVSV